MKYFVFFKKLLAFRQWFSPNETFTTDRGINFIITTYGLQSPQYKQLVKTLLRQQSYSGRTIDEELENLSIDDDELLKPNDIES